MGVRHVTLRFRTCRLCMILEIFWLRAILNHILWEEVEQKAIEIDFKNSSGSLVFQQDSRNSNSEGSESKGHLATILRLQIESYITYCDYGKLLRFHNCICNKILTLHQINTTISCQGRKTFYLIQFKNNRS